MPRKASPADRFRQALMEAVRETSLDSSGYCRLAAQAMLQVSMEVQATEFIGRSSYERCTARQSTWCSRFKRRKVTTGEGPVELFVPQNHPIGGDGKETVARDDGSARGRSAHKKCDVKLTARGALQSIRYRYSPASVARNRRSLFGLAARPESLARRSSAPTG